MQQKQDVKILEASTLRYRLLDIHTRIIKSTLGPSVSIQTILQIFTYIQVLKFSIDYYSDYWFDSKRPIISFLDFSYIIRTFIPSIYIGVLYIVVGIMFIYIMMVISLIKPITKKIGMVIEKIIKNCLVAFSSVLLMPFLGMILGVKSCEMNNQFWKCQSIIVSNGAFWFSLIIFIIFVVLILAQSYLNFQFVCKPKDNKINKNSANTSIILKLYIILNEVSYMLWPGIISCTIIGLMVFGLLITFIAKNQHLRESSRRVEFTLIFFNTVTVTIANFQFFFNFPITFEFMMVSLFVFVLVFLLLDSFTLKFQLQNINKWTSPLIAIQYCRTIRNLLKSCVRYNHPYNQILCGYVEIHLQKCEQPTCPYRDSSYLIHGFQNKSEEIHLTEQLLKKIYSEGIKVTPIHPQLQLEFSIFLYQISQRDMSLKNLLAIDWQQLSLESYFKYFSLKNRIFSEISEQPQHLFLDLISELEVKRMESEILKKFEEAALNNLQFWSILNDDHPDFQKLSQIGQKRVLLSQEVNEKYKQICQFAHSEKITSVYINYLSSIQNEDQMYNQIHERIKNIHSLDRKIILQDWSSNSDPTVLISVEEHNYGTIIGLNSTFALMLGYQKYQILRHHCKILFHQETHSQLTTFLNDLEKLSSYYFLHKNGYLLKLKSNNQNYNSMETGLTIIITLTNQLNSNSGFILGTKQHLKAIGCSSSCISLLGLQNKHFDTFGFIPSLLTFNTQSMSQLSLSENSFALNQILSKEYFNKIGQIQHIDQNFSITFRDVGSDLIAFELAMLKPNLVHRQIECQIQHFQFHIQANLQQFEYIGQHSEQQSYLRQFSQFSLQKEQMMRVTSFKNYGSNITTLRLYENIIRVIEDIEDVEASNNNNSENHQQQQITEKIARKLEDQIFQNKFTYEKFILQNQVPLGMKWVMIIGVIINLAMYVGYCFIHNTHNIMTSPLLIEVANENLLLGTLAKSSSYLKGFQQHLVNKSNQNLNYLTKAFLKNIKQTERLKNNASTPRNIIIYPGNDNSTQATIFSDEFYTSIMNQQLNLLRKIGDPPTSITIKNNYPPLNSKSMLFLTLNTNYTKQYLLGQLMDRQSAIKNRINNCIMIQIAMLIGAVTMQIVFSVFLILFVYFMHKKKVAILSIFLNITEEQILKFNAKTEHFLTSLQMEERAEEMEQEQQNENKKNSALFTKTKRFKVITVQKSAFIKMIIIPLFGLAYFFNSFASISQNLKFDLNSVDYISLTSSADNIFYDGTAKLQTKILRNQTSSNISVKYLGYYRTYFSTHYQTFGKIDQFHLYFTQIFMRNICNGTNIKIPESCLIPSLSSNGSLLIFTDITVKTEESTFQNDFPLTYYQSLSVLSRTHQILTQKALLQQNQNSESKKQQLMTEFFIWFFCFIGVVFVYGIPAIKSLTDNMNIIKNMMTIVPLPIAKQSAQVNAFINKTINPYNCFK